MEDYDISPIQSDFEQIKKLNKNGQEYWPSRDLCTALGYSTFEKVFVCHNGTLLFGGDHYILSGIIPLFISILYPKWYKSINLAELHNVEHLI